MPVGVTAAAAAIARAALAHEHHGLLGGDDAGADGRGDLADAVPGAGADLAEGVGRVREEARAA